MRISVLAVDMDNGPAWALLDLAATEAGICVVPIPPFFSNHQVEHCLRQAGAELILTDNQERLLTRIPGQKITGAGELRLFDTQVHILRTGLPKGLIPQDAAKLTFTSGTTAEPKGVLLTRQQIEAVVKSLVTAVGVERDDRHLCLMPLSILLENIAGLYAPLWSGATAVLPSLKETGLIGVANLDVQRMMHNLQNSAATTTIFTPQLLQGAIEYLEQGHDFKSGLRFVAVGGATVSKQLLIRAEKVGLPVYEGYGLSEVASVATLNHPGDRRIGSVGKPLPHLNIRIADDGEVLIKNNRFLGYLGESPMDGRNDWWHTGDVGSFDNDGFLYLKGRKKHLFITAYGRNVSPEWVERELVLEPAISQAALYGEAQPWNLAVIVPAEGVDQAEIERAVHRVNRELPDYARVRHWFTADAPFALTNKQLSGTGRIRRQSIYQYYQSRIAAYYHQEHVS